MDTKYLFFVGKGGVGKSSTSALTALFNAEQGKELLLVSMDPAHNQCDIFENKFSQKEKKITDKLGIIEIDLDFWIKRYLKDTKEHIKRVYAYQSAFNLSSYFKILKYSPGLEEYALLLAFEDIVKKYDKKKDIIIFDMPPTALTLRFFSLPFITLVWLGELLKLRKEIVQKKEIVSKISLGKNFSIETDKIKTKLEEMIDRNEKLNNFFVSDKIGINLVLNYDKLSFVEAKRLKKSLEDLGIKIEKLVVNRIENENYVNEIKKEFENDNILLFKKASFPLSGVNNLRNYINEYMK